MYPVLNTTYLLAKNHQTNQYHIVKIFELTIQPWMFSEFSTDKIFGEFVEHLEIEFLVGHEFHCNHTKLIPLVVFSKLSQVLLVEYVG